MADPIIVGDYLGVAPPWWVQGVCDQGDMMPCANVVAEWVALVDLDPPAAPAPKPKPKPKPTGTPTSPAQAAAVRGEIDPVGVLAGLAIVGGLWWWFRGQ